MSKKIASSLIAFLTLPAIAGSVAAADMAQRIIPQESKQLYAQLHYAPAIVTGNDIFLSGVSGKAFEGNDAIEKQFDDAFAQLKRNLEASGSDLSHVKEIYSYHIDLLKHGLTFLKVKDKYFPGPNYPTWTSVGITELAPGAKLELVARAEKIDGGDVLVRRDVPGKEAAKLHYQPGVIDGDLVFLAGLSGNSKDTSVEEQFRDAFERLKLELEAVGSSLDDIIELDSFHVDIAKHMALFETVRANYIKHPVIWNPVGIEGIVDPNGLLELTVRAKVSSAKQAVETMTASGSMEVSSARFADIHYIGTVYADKDQRGDSLESEANAAFLALQEKLKAIGADFSDVIEFNSYHSVWGVEGFTAFQSVKDRYLKEPYPTWNGIGVSQLAEPDARVAISARVRKK